MTFNPLFTSDSSDPLENLFRGYVNLAYSVSVAGDLARNALDDVEVLEGYRTALKKACELAKKQTEAQPLNKPLRFYHVFLIESELIDVFGSAPAACQEVSLSVRRYMFEFSVHFRTFYGMSSTLEMSN